MNFKKVSFFNTVIARSLKPAEILKRKLTLICVTAEVTDRRNNLENCLSADDIVKIKKDKNTFLILDYSKEGYSYKKNSNLFFELELFCTKHQIDSNKIFYLSSNLKEAYNFESWKNETDSKLHVHTLSFCYWIDHARLHFHVTPSIESVIENFDSKKLFLSLNRRIKLFRTLTILNIFQSSIFNNTLISFDKLTIDHLLQVINHFELTVSHDTILKLSNNSPSIVDTADFVEELSNTEPWNAFKSTTVSLVSETLSESDNNTSLFYSEKTFKPMNFYHPVMIFGQPGANTCLTELGFKTYDQYFDLSFDNIEDPVSRLTAQINILEKLNLQMSSFSESQKVDWLLQDFDTLKHNKQSIQDNMYNKCQALKFLSIVDSLI